MTVTTRAHPAGGGNPTYGVQGDHGVSLPCPRCNGPTKVVEVRLRAETQNVRRRRECAPEGRGPCLDDRGFALRGTSTERWDEDERDELLDQTMDVT